VGTGEGELLHDPLVAHDLVVNGDSCARTQAIAYSLAASRPSIFTSPGASKTVFSPFRSRMRLFSQALRGVVD
jgi:hypothetical protein